jgi:hypothetical protein
MNYVTTKRRRFGRTERAEQEAAPRLPRAAWPIGLAALLFALWVALGARPGF